MYIPNTIIHLHIGSSMKNKSPFCESGHNTTDFILSLTPRTNKTFSLFQFLVNSFFVHYKYRNWGNRLSICSHTQFSALWAMAFAASKCDLKEIPYILISRWKHLQRLSMDTRKRSHTLKVEIMYFKIYLAPNIVLSFN